MRGIALHGGRFHCSTAVYPWELRGGLLHTGAGPRDSRTFREFAVRAYASSSGCLM